MNYSSAGRSAGIHEDEVLVLPWRSLEKRRSDTTEFRRVATDDKSDCGWAAFDGERFDLLFDIVFEDLKVGLSETRHRPVILTRDCDVGRDQSVIRLDFVSLLLAAPFPAGAAIGSGRWRIVRQLLTESVALSLLGALVSLVVIASGMNALLKWLPEWIPRLNEVAIDNRVLLFTTVVSVTTSIVFGILPALSASRLDLSAAFKTSNRAATSTPGRLRLRS